MEELSVVDNQLSAEVAKQLATGTPVIVVHGSTPPQYYATAVAIQLSNTDITIHFKVARNSTDVTSDADSLCGVTIPHAAVEELADHLATVSEVLRRAYGGSIPRLLTPPEEVAKINAQVIRERHGGKNA